MSNNSGKLKTILEIYENKGG